MSRPLKFLHLTTFYPPYSFGGDAMYIYRLAHALGDEGHQVEVVHCVDSYHLLHREEPEIAFAEHPNVQRHELRSGYGWLSPLLTQQTGRPWLKRKQITDLLNDHAYDVVHYHNISLLGPEVLTLRPQNGRSPVKLYTTHEHWLICPMHVLWKFGRRACEKPACIRCTVLGKRPPQLWRYTDMLYEASKHVDLFVSPSRFTAQMHADRGFPRPVAHLPYFIERVDHEWKNPEPRPHERPYFLFVGRLEKIKGVHLLIELWDRAGDYDLLVAGTGSYEKEIRARALGKKKIRFLGPVSQNDLGKFYFHAVATVIPSITYETFGVIVLESFARKSPVIVHAIGALAELIDESQGGLTYTSEHELLSALRRVAGSRLLRDELGSNGYQAFVRNWSRAAHAKAYFGLLRTVAGAKFGCVPWEPEPGMENGS